MDDVDWAFSIIGFYCLAILLAWVILLKGIFWESLTLKMRRGDREDKILFIGAWTFIFLSLYPVYKIFFGKLFL